MTARRSTRLLLAPAVLALLALLAVRGGSRGVLVAVVAGTYWLVGAIADYSKRLVISDEQLHMSGYVGGAMTVRLQDAVSCTYAKVPYVDSTGAHTAIVYMGQRRTYFLHTCGR